MYRQQQQEQETSGIYMGELPNGSFYIGTELPDGGFATDAGDNKGPFGGSIGSTGPTDIQGNTGETEPQGTLRNTGFDCIQGNAGATSSEETRFIRIGDLVIDRRTGLPKVCEKCNKWVFDPKKHISDEDQDDDDRQPTLPPPPCGDDVPQLRMCNACSYWELPGSWHTDDLRKECQPAVFGCSHRIGGYVDFDGNKVIVVHSEKEPVYLHDLQCYRSNCLTCGCVVHQESVNFACYCSEHDKHGCHSPLKN